MKDGVTVLEEAPLEKSRWKNAGFETPQATLQTFLWAMREGDWKIIASCSDSPGTIKPSEADLERQKKGAEAATGYLAMAIRAIEHGAVELKFQVTGWSTSPLVHKMKRIGGEWKFDTSSSTIDAAW